MIRRGSLTGALALALAFAPTAFAEDTNTLLPEAPAKAVVVRACTSCHQSAVLVAKPHTADEWDEIIGKMVDRGAQLTDAEEDQVLAYLAKNFGPTAAAAPSSGGAAQAPTAN